MLCHLDGQLQNWINHYKVKKDEVKQWYEISIILIYDKNIIKYTMGKNIQLLHILITIILVTISQQVDCNSTHF